jgi:hypothetical protein
LRICDERQPKDERGHKLQKASGSSRHLSS